MVQPNSAHDIIAKNIRKSLETAVVPTLKKTKSYIAVKDELHIVESRMKVYNDAIITLEKLERDIKSLKTKINLSDSPNKKLFDELSNEFTSLNNLIIGNVGWIDNATLASNGKHINAVTELVGIILAHPEDFFN